MLPAPRRAPSQPSPLPKFDDIHEDDDDDDEGWQDMPVVRSEDLTIKLEMDPDDPRSTQYRVPAQRMDDDTPAAGPSNATGTHLELEADTLLTDSWREKAALDESDYTRIRLDEDEESEEVHMRTRYLFDEDKAMTPLSQMQATKELLTEGQRIAYVGLCYLVAKRMVRDAGRGWEGHQKLSKKWGKGKEKGEVPVVESAGLWLIKIMARLFQHMDLNRDEQRMIESLGEHGVDSSDLVPALTTTHTVKNPEFDPMAKKQLEDEKAKELEMEQEEDVEPPPPYKPSEEPAVDPEPQPVVADLNSPTAVTSPLPRPSVKRRKSINPFGDDSDEEEAASIPTPPRSNSLDPFTHDPSATARDTPSPHRPSSLRLPSFHEDEDDGDIGRAGSPSRPSPSSTSPAMTPTSPSRSQTPTKASLKSTSSLALPIEPAATPRTEKPPDSVPEIHEPEPAGKPEVEADPDDLSKPSGLPSLPGVSTSLTNADELVTLDIRWTVLCDLFLVLIADSVFDARSRVFLQQVAEALGFSWLDVVRFENRVTDALEIQEGMEKTAQGDLIEGRRKGALRKRYAMMGAAAVGGGLIIGLSAGLLAPVIGAGLGAAFATVGISGTTGFLAGAGGAAMITTGGVLTGANIAGKGMARRTREVRTFELRPMHNNKRVSCIITVGGFMASKVDDVRLPFSTLDPIIGDVLSVLWEPDMMQEMGSALKILTGEILTQVGQQVLQATVMYGLMSALQWPIILTKLGYLIDNPWSNALDRARAAGLILADVILNRHAGVRPITLIGFSLGARQIFYALVELARHKAFGLVQDVFIFGTTVTASRQTWLDVRSVVGGRFVNGFATNDWMLGYLFRATSGGLNTVAGLRPVELIPGMENVEVTDMIFGHMSYRSCMPQLLARCGFPITAEHFDEPDDPEIDMSVQERIVVTEEEEEARRNQKKILGIFPRRSGSKANSGHATPNPRTSTEKPDEKTTEDEGDDLPPREDSDDDLPPREDDNGDIGIPESGPDPRAEERKRAKQEAEALQAIPKTAGFDFAAISKELGKDINVERLPDPSREPVTPLPAPAPPIDRAGSAPPPEASHFTAPEPEPSPPILARSSSYMDAFQNREGMDGDITTSLESVTAGLSLNDLPAWERPMPRESSPWDQPVPAPRASSPSISPPLSASTKSIFNFNAWSSAANSLPGRAAPPARPHPAEYMTGGDGRGYTKKEEDLATGTQNPW